jgi:hypothetical protein
MALGRSQICCSFREKEEKEEEAGEVEEEEGDDRRTGLRGGTLRARSSSSSLHRWYLILNAFTILFAANTSGMTLDLTLTMIIHHVAPPKNVSEAFDTLTKG